MELSELCQELKNWFDVKRIYGTFVISGGSISIPELQNDQYFRIVGSIFNDGVHQYPTNNLKDETFEGAIWPMAIPAEVLALKDDIDEWIAKYGESASSPFQSESFGGYSYSKGSGSSAGSSSVSGWQESFRSRLNKWRKI